MFLLRKIGKVLRGAATPFQIHLACLFGAMLGFVPSFTRAPATVIGLTLLLFIFNANLAVAGLIGLAAKLASLALMGVSFGVGRWLLDGPPSAFFRDLINAPVFAYCGLEWYACSGGLVLGLLFGIVSGFAVSLPMQRFRATMTRVEEKSSFYQRNKGNPLVRFLFWVLFGPRHQWDSYQKLIGKRFGNPVRIAGIVVAVAVIAGIWYGAGKFSGPMLRESLRGGLESANGATVDLGRLELDLDNNRIALHDLAIADSEELTQDLFRAAHLEGDLSGSELLSRRLKIDRLVVSEARHGALRATPATRTAPPVEPSPPEPTTDPAADKTIDQWLEQGEVWEKRLKQAKEWLAKIKRPASAEDKETLRERLEREAREKGWGNVAANHLITGAPLVQIGELVVEGIVSDSLGTLIDLHIENLSSNPSLVDGAPRVTLKTRDGRYSFDASLAGEARVPGQSFLDVQIANLPTELITAPLAARTGVKPLEGGTLQTGFRLGWDALHEPTFNQAFAVTVKDSTLNLGQLGATAVKELAIPLVVRGALDNPRVRVELDGLADSLLKGGFAQFGQKVKDEALRRADALKAGAVAEAERLKAQAVEKGEALTEKATDAVQEQAAKALQDALDGAGKDALKDGLKDGLEGSGKELLDGLKGGGKETAQDGKEAGKNVAEDAKKAAEGLRDLNPFGKKKDPKKKDDPKQPEKPKDGAKPDEKPATPPPGGNGGGR